MVERFLQRLLPKQSALLAITEKARAWISCVIYSEDPPALFFESEIIRDIARLGLGLDFDLYYFDL
jgi:hypothetical protein